MNNQLEQIKAEIESLKNCSSPIVICDTLLSFINSLQQELLSSVETAESCEKEKKPVSEDLEDASIEIYSKLLKDETIIIDGYEYVVLSDAEECFKAGANWQKQQMEKYRIAHCDNITNEQAEMESDFVSEHIAKNNRIPTFLDAIKYGMKLQEQQMMKDAVEAEVVTPVYKGPDTKMTQLVTFGTSLKVGDKVKLIIIPETPEYTEGVTGHYTTTTK
jgi:hypothetical protein